MAEDPVMQNLLRSGFKNLPGRLSGKTDIRSGYISYGPTLCKKNGHKVPSGPFGYNSPKKMTQRPDEWAED